MDRKSTRRGDRFWLGGSLALPVHSKISSPNRSGESAEVASADQVSSPTCGIVRTMETAQTCRAVGGSAPAPPAESPPRRSKWNRLRPSRRTTAGSKSRRSSRRRRSSRDSRRPARTPSCNRGRHRAESSRDRAPRDRRRVSAAGRWEYSRHPALSGTRRRDRGTGRRMRSGRSQAVNRSDPFFSASFFRSKRSADFQSGSSNLPSRWGRSAATGSCRAVWPAAIRLAERTTLRFEHSVARDRFRAAT